MCFPLPLPERRYHQTGGTLKKGFSVPDRVKNLMREYKVENNHVIQFVEKMRERFAGKENAKLLATIT